MYLKVKNPQFKIVAVERSIQYGPERRIPSSNAESEVQHI